MGHTEMTGLLHSSAQIYWVVEKVAYKKILLKLKIVFPGTIEIINLYEHLFNHSVRVIICAWI